MNPHQHPTPNLRLDVAQVNPELEDTAGTEFCSRITPQIRSCRLGKGGPNVMRTWGRIDLTSQMIMILGN